MNYKRVKRLLKPSWAERKFYQTMGLWYFVFGFRREYQIGRHYVDFATKFGGRRVAIEVDGAAYHKDVVKDWQRDKDLEAKGWAVVRIEASALNDPRRVRRQVVRFIFTAPKLKHKRITKK